MPPKHPTSSRAWRKHRAEVLPLLEKRCAAPGCPRSEDFDERGRWSLTVDHVVPLDHGGPLCPGLEGLRVMHHGCNARRGIATTTARRRAGLTGANGSPPIVRRRATPELPPETTRSSVEPRDAPADASARWPFEGCICKDPDAVVGEWCTVHRDAVNPGRDARGHCPCTRHPVCGAWCEIHDRRAVVWYGGEQPRPPLAGDEVYAETAHLDVADFELAMFARHGVDVDALLENLVELDEAGEFGLEEELEETAGGNGHNGHGHLPAGWELAERMKRCNTCRGVKPLADFAPDASKRDRRAGRCRACDRRRSRPS